MEPNGHIFTQAPQLTRLTAEIWRQTAAAQSAADADTSADRAEQAAATQGYLYFYIDSNGDLIYQRTDNVDVTFYLDDGSLFVRG